MASRAIIKRKFLSAYLNAPVRPVHAIQNFSSGQSTHYIDFCGYSSLANHFSQDHSKDADRNKVVSNKLLRFMTPSSLSLYKFNGTVLPGYRNTRLDLCSPLGLRFISQAYYSSSDTPEKPDLGSSDDAGKKRKEASPEECDQAVLGLSTAKAKAKAKRSQESEKFAASVLQRMWSVLLGIGPAIRAVASMTREDWAKKLVHWKDKFISTLQRYWLGCKLLWVDVRISSRLLLKLTRGKSLSRRERQQLTQTTADIFRLVPFAVFIIVPFMEVLLPVFLKLFPNMLPSTFQDKMKKEEALIRKLNARIEYAKFLQDTAKEMAKEVQKSKSGEMKRTAEDLDELLNRVRRGAGVSNTEILGFAKLFNDELTLDNISRPQLVNMCKYMGISAFGTDFYLRFMLRKRLQSIKSDDKLIQAEGVDSLSEAELREDCRERGMLGLLSVEEMRQQLRDWLDLSLNHSVPSSLLILSRAFSISGKLKPEEAVRATLSSLPDEVVNTVGIATLPSERRRNTEGSVSERRRKLLFLKRQEELIKEEEGRMKEERARKKISVESREDVALKEMIIPTATEAQEQARAIALDKRDELCKLSRALSVLASASSVSREREEFLRLVNKEIEFYNSMVDKEGTENEHDAMMAYRSAHKESKETDEGAAHQVSSALINKVDAMLQKLEKEIDAVDAKIGDHWRILDRDYDGKVTPEEVAAAAMYLKDTLDKEGVQELISNLSKDRDGKILVEDIVRLGSRVEDGAAKESKQT